MVFLLGRVGDNKKALNLIISRLGDVERVSRAEARSPAAPLTLSVPPGDRLRQGAERRRALGGSAQVLGDQAW
jgi:hypothetical protein